MMMNRILLSRLASKKVVQTNFKSILIPSSARYFADVAVVGQQAKTEIESQESIWARLGVDAKFD
jgi:hypothetical protein